jgi:hypothetical protein
VQRVDSGMVTHPYSIYIWQPPLSPTGIGHWNEPNQAYTEQWAIYVARLIHQDSHSEMKVVRYELNIACFPDEHAVELENDRLLNKRSFVIQRSIKSLCKFPFGCGIIVDTITIVATRENMLYLASLLRKLQLKQEGHQGV